MHHVMTEDFCLAVPAHKAACCRLLLCATQPPARLSPLGLGAEQVLPKQGRRSSLVVAFSESGEAAVAVAVAGTASEQPVAVAATPPGALRLWVPLAIAETSEKPVAPAAPTPIILSQPFAPRTLPAFAISSLPSSLLALATQTSVRLDLVDFACRLPSLCIDRALHI